MKMNRLIKFSFVTQIMVFAFFTSSLSYGNECTGSMAFCLDKEYKDADKALNISFKKVRSKLTKEQKLALRDAQRSWIKYRDSNCEMYWAFNEVKNPQTGPELHRGGQAKVECLAEMTKKRKIELDDLLFLFE